MKKIILLILACGSLSAGQAQISITSTSLTYTQNFDMLDTAVYSTSNPGSSNLPAGWSIFEYGTSTTRSNNLYVGDFGNSNTGDTYSYGSVNSLERALGSLASGSVVSHYGAKFVNNIGTAIVGFAIRYRGEQWRMGSAGRTNPDSLRFLYSTAATGVSDTSSAAAYTENFGLMLTTPNMAASTGALDGNLGANSTIKTGVVPVTIPNGGTLVIKWIDRNIGGNDDALALDSVSIAFTLAGNQPNIVALSPAPMSSGVPASSNLTITFDKNVSLGTSGKIYINNRTSRSTYTVAVTSSNLSVAGKVATIVGAGAIDPGSFYNVTFDSTVFDTAGIHSRGIYDTSIWTFSTAPATSSVAGFNAASLQFTVMNPGANGTFIIYSTLPQAAILTARIYDINGRQLRNEVFSAVNGENRLALKTALPAGDYLIRVDDGLKWGSAKITVQ